MGLHNSLFTSATDSKVFVHLFYVVGKFGVYFSCESSAGDRHVMLCGYTFKFHQSVNVNQLP